MSTGRSLRQSIEIAVVAFKSGSNAVDPDVIKQIKRVGIGSELTDILRSMKVNPQEFLRRLDTFDDAGNLKQVKNFATADGTLNKEGLTNALRNSGYVSDNIDDAIKNGENAANTPSVASKLRKMYNDVGGIYGIGLAAITGLFIYHFVLEEGNISEALKKTAGDLGSVAGEVASSAGEAGNEFLKGLFKGAGLWIMLLIFAIFGIIIIVTIL